MDIVVTIYMDLRPFTNDGYSSFSNEKDNMLGVADAATTVNTALSRLTPTITATTSSYNLFTLVKKLIAIHDATHGLCFLS